MKARFMAVCAVLLFMVTPLLYSESTASRDDTYVFYVEQVECDVSHLQIQNMGSDKLPLTTMIHHDEMVAFQDAKVIKFPALELAPGQQQEIDQQHQIKYPTAFDAKGNPAEFSTRNIGKKICIGLITATNGVVPNLSFKGREKTTVLILLSFDFEDVILLSTDRYSNVQTAELEGSNPQVKQSGNASKAPVFYYPNVRGSITVWPGGWFQLGGIPDGNPYMAWFLKVEKK